jgi:hypothetical protein
LDNANNRARLATILEEGISAGGDALCYTVLPCHWNGYAKGDLEAAFAEVSIRKTESGGSWHYRVSHVHEASGEEATYSFSTGKDVLRSLRGPFSVRTTNSAPDLYQTVAIEGELAAGEVRLTVNGELPFVSGRVAGPLTCSWSLFDALPEIASAGIRGIDLLEDLEKVKTGLSLTPFEDFTLRLGDTSLPLHGYIVHGEAEVPEYYWLTDDGRVAIMVRTFSTYVLGGAG